MLGVVGKDIVLSELFEKHKEIVEVYSNVNFKLDNKYADFYILCKGDVDVPTIYRTLNDLYPDAVHVYIVKNQLSPALLCKRIIWRKGRWYI